LQEIADTNLRPEFVEQMKLFRQKIFKKVRPKKLNGNYINGDMLLELCYAYTKAFNSGGVPCIENAWNSMCKAQCTKIMEDSLISYIEELGKTAEEKGFDPQLIKASHQEIKDKIIKNFKKQSIGDSSIQYEEALKQRIADKYKEFKKMTSHKITVTLSGNDNNRVNMKKS
jgi:hypothetical protein